MSNVKRDSVFVCGACVYWHKVPDEDGHELGQCRRYPPSYEGWPMTFGQDWCGEFAASTELTAN